MRTPSLNRRTALRAAALALGLLSCGLGSAVRAADWPSRPIRVIVPFTPGGGTDIIARAVAQAVAQEQGWTVVVENRPGAGGNIGIDAVAKAAPDGYTIALGQTSNLAINPTPYRQLPYDPNTDLRAVSLVAEAPLVLVTGASTAHRSLNGVLDQARQRPDALNFASPGSGTVAHLASVLLEQAAGVKMQHVPYRGVAQALPEVVGGRVDLYMSAIPTLIAQIRSGQLRALAVTSRTRLKELPDVPTVAEAGQPGFEASTWFGFVAPARTPEPVIRTLSEAVAKAMQSPALRSRLDAEGALPRTGTPQEFSDLIRSDIERWAPVVRSSGATVD